MKNNVFITLFAMMFASGCTQERQQVSHKATSETAMQTNSSVGVWGKKDQACVGRCGKNIGSCQDRKKSDGRTCLKRVGVAEDLALGLVGCIAGMGTPPSCIASAGTAVLSIASKVEPCLDNLGEALIACKNDLESCISACPDL